MDTRHMEEFCSEKDQTYTQCLSLYVSTKYIHIIKEQKHNYMYI